MTVKKMSKILTFILVLAMVLGTVAMADQSDGTNTGNTTNDTYTITAGRFENGTLTIKYDSTQSPLTAGATSKAIAKGTEVTILAEPNAHHAADQTDHSGFGEEHGANGTQLGAQHLHDADLLGALIDGHDHGIGNADGGDKQRDSRGNRTANAPPRQS